MKRITMMLMALLLTPVMALATTWYVDGTNGSDSFSGKSQSLAKKTIQAAIDDSEDGDTIFVEAGTYAPISAASRHITIRSLRGAKQTVIDGGKTNRCVDFYVAGSDDNGIDLNEYVDHPDQYNLIVGFTIQNGYAYKGGGVRHGRAQNCIFRWNNCDWLCGSALEVGSAENCLFYDNTKPAAGWSLLINCTLCNDDVWAGFTYNCIVRNGSIALEYQGKSDNNFFDDPHFNDEENGDFSLSADSPCVDSGVNTYVATSTDLNGNARIANGTVDIGCYEYGSSQSITDGLVAWYKFDGNANDSSGNGNDGVVHGATLATDRYGKADGAYSFSYGDWIQITDSPSLHSVTQAMTFSTWVKLDNTSSYLPFFCKGATSRQFGFELYADSSEQNIVLNDVNGTGSAASVEVRLPYGTIKSGEWCQIAVTYDGNMISGYVNGVLVASTVVSDRFKANSDDLYIGIDKPGTSTEAFTGDMDDARIYNRALSATEITAIYNENNGSATCRTVTFNANGGSCSTTSRSVTNGTTCGALPTATRTGYTFLGWFTAEEGGEQVSAETVVTADVTWYAHWAKTFKVIVGAGCSIDVGLQKYTAKGLPKGLAYNRKTGKVTGVCKMATEASGVTVTFSKSGKADVFMQFIARAEAKPSVACPELANGTLGVGVGTDGFQLTFNAESGVKQITASNLPLGMRLVKNSSTRAWMIIGTPAKAGEFKVKLTLTTMAGGVAKKTIKIAVAPLPAGTFNGFVLASVTGATVPKESTVNCGTVQMSIADTGKITANVRMADGTYAFAANAWDSVKDGVYTVKLADKSRILTLACDTNGAWNERQLTGTLLLGKGKSALTVEAQKNAFGRQWFFRATGGSANGWKLTFADSAAAATLTITLNADGTTMIAGQLDAYKITASGYADVSGIATGAIFADFAPVITTGKKKKVLSIRTNLWFDKSNDHVEGVGTVAFAQ